MRKVLILTRDLSYPGGSEKFMLNMLLDNNSKDLQFYLFEIEGSGKFTNLHIYKLLEQRGVKVVRKDFGNDFSYKKILFVSNLIRTEQIDIVHSFLFNADLVAFFCKLGNKKALDLMESIPSRRKLSLILTGDIFENDENLEPTKFLWVSTKFCSFSVDLEKDTEEWHLRKSIIDNELESVISKCCDYIVAVTNNIKKLWASKSRSPITVIPCTSIGLDDLSRIEELINKKSQLRREYNIPTDKLVFTYVGRLEINKGILELIKAFNIISNNHNNSILLVVGDGTISDDVKKISADNAFIKILGHKDHKEILEIDTLSDFFCLFSYSEGLPLAVQEAMSTFNPILCSNAGGIPDLVRKNNGKLIDVKDIGTKSILNTLDWAFGLSSVERKTLSQNSYKRIKDLFLNESSFNKYHKLYERL